MHVVTIQTNNTNKKNEYIDEQIDRFLESREAVCRPTNTIIVIQVNARVAESRIRRFNDRASVAIKLHVW